MGPEPWHSRGREVVVELAGSVVAGQLQPSAASLGNHCSQDDGKYQWPACFELCHDLRIVVYVQVSNCNSLPMILCDSFKPQSS